MRGSIWAMGAVVWAVSGCGTQERCSEQSDCATPSTATVTTGQTGSTSASETGAGTQGGSSGEMDTSAGTQTSVGTQTSTTMGSDTGMGTDTGTPTDTSSGSDATGGAVGSIEEFCEVACNDCFNGNAGWHMLPAAECIGECIADFDDCPERQVPQILECTGGPGCPAGTLDFGFCVSPFTCLL